MAVMKDGLGFLVADINRLMRRAFRQRLAMSDLTLAQSRALVYVSRHQGVRQVELAELLDIAPISLARLVDQLAELGLVERRSDPTDRRAHRIHLMPAATPHLEAIGIVIDEIRGIALAGFDAGEAERLLGGLLHLRGNLAEASIKTEAQVQHE